MPVAAVDASVDAAGAGQRGVLENMAVHLCRLVQVPRRVIFYGREENGEDGGRSRFGSLILSIKWNNSSQQEKETKVKIDICP